MGLESYSSLAQIYNVQRMNCTNIWGSRSWKGPNRRNVKLWCKIHTQKRYSWLGCMV